jgi:hypothetical protein
MGICTRSGDNKLYSQLVIDVFVVVIVVVVLVMVMSV